MDKSIYHRTHTSKRRKHTSGIAQNKASRPRFISFLLACAGLFAFAAGINYMFPHFSKALGDRVSEVVDYRSAFAVIGEGISGEKKLGAALTEAWAEAFDKNADGKEISVMSEPSVTTPVVADRSEFTDALIQAFAESQLDYADYMTPAGVDYSLI